MPTRVGDPVPEQARTGRQHQRYGDNGERLVAGCIPVKFIDDIEAPENILVLQITSRNGEGWVFPKGGWETNESVEQAAQRETVEEAGVRGDLIGDVLGKFPFDSRKVYEGRCIAHMFVMRVQEVLNKWPEQHQRNRRWVSVQEALGDCKYQWMKEALVIWMLRSGWGQVLQQNGSSQIQLQLPVVKGVNPQANGVQDEIS
eukprot:TRINITY_DN760_c1_g2_i1.p1 TRINITY_DN760_c1_g2~~TRINITY_DN760_c1_g2_i1.p1  ORF type:complete len:201 (-),score=36.96 TRINITY_DN760_c1_g2_i1:749-1351(-)